MLCISRCSPIAKLGSRCFGRRPSESVCCRVLGRSWRSCSASIGHDVVEATACIPDSDLDTFARLIQDARGPDRRGRSVIRGPNGLPNLLGERPCTLCGEFKPLSEFYKAPTKIGVQASCKSCKLHRVARFNRTLRGNVAQMLGSARQRAKLKGLVFSLSRDCILDMLQNQGGRCHYSSIEMEYLQPNSHWRVSLERICNHSGYTTSNCVLIAAEFNASDRSRNRGVREIHGTSQWSRAKVVEVPVLQNRYVPLVYLDRDLIEARCESQRGKGKCRPACAPNSAGLWECSSCGLFKPEQDFYLTMGATIRRSSSCKECKCGFGHEYRRTLRGTISTAMSSARSSAAKRGQACSLTHEFLLETLWSQRGRCFYSGVPLEYRLPQSNWRMSVERLDNEVGYVPENCVLVAAEFNTPDYSRNKSVYPVHGTAQWSRAKAMQVWGDRVLSLM